MVKIRPPCPLDIPPIRGELKGCKTGEHTIYATFLLAGLLNIGFYKTIYLSTPYNG